MLKNKSVINVRPVSVGIYATRLADMAPATPLHGPGLQLSLYGHIRMYAAFLLLSLHQMRYEQLEAADNNVLTIHKRPVMIFFLLNRRWSYGITLDK